MSFLREIQFDDGEYGREGPLYITDSSVMARELVSNGCAVLVRLHEGNRKEDFSFCQYVYEADEETDSEPDMDYLKKVYRRCKGLPWDILETERCLVRETTVDDVEEFYRIYSEPSIVEYMEPLYEEPEKERAYARDYIRQVYAFYNFGMWTVVEKVSGQVIGRAGIYYREGCELPELGFVIEKDRQGQGLATEVCRAILQYGYEEFGFDKILAFVRPGNAPSHRVCARLGMRRMENVVLKGQEYAAYVWIPQDYLES